ncbi:MAG TPA: hypothetical protein VJ728_05635 [Candidatus Binataceae bacterium]|nr:hypothetical protein [Candidatus Binataceae bacterium]
MCRLPTHLVHSPQTKTLTSQLGGAESGIDHFKFYFGHVHEKPTHLFQFVSPTPDRRNVLNEDFLWVLAEIIGMKAWQLAQKCPQPFRHDMAMRFTRFHRVFDYRFDELVCLLPPLYRLAAVRNHKAATYLSVWLPGDTFSLHWNRASLYQLSGELANDHFEFLKVHRLGEMRVEAGVLTPANL